MWSGGLVEVAHPKVNLPQITSLIIRQQSTPIFQYIPENLNSK